MEQNSILESSPEQNTAATAVNVEAASAPASQPEEAASAAPTRRRASRRVTAATAAADAQAAADAPAAPAADASEAPAAEDGAPKKRVSRARKKVEPADEAPEAATEAPAPAAEVASEEAPKKAPARRRRAQSAPVAEADAANAQADQASSPAASTQADASGETAAADTSNDDTAANGEKPEGAAAETTPRKRNTRSRSRKSPAEQTDAQAEQVEGENAEKSSENDEQAGAAGNNGNGRGNNSNNNDGQTRSSRTRQRERKRRGGNDDEPEITEDDVLLPVAGILDVLDNYAFVRTTGYLPGTGDVYVSLGQVKKYGLRKGDAVVGAIRQPREGDNGGRQKYNAIVKVDSINSKPVDEEQTRPEFADFTPVHPNERLRLETDAANLGARAIDLFAPIGKGQRGFIVGQHESGKSTALRQIAQAVAKNQPDAHLMLVVIDERPEDVTELQRTVNGEVIASTFERPAEDHATIVELAVERAKRLVELGHDVVVLIDSLTSLARAYNVAAPAAVRVPAGSLDAAAVYPVKRLLSAARNIENGGSLTIIATVSAEPGSKFDEALLGEIEGIANMQLRLSSDAADRRVYPAVDLSGSWTRNEATLTSEAESRIMNRIRRSQPTSGAVEHLEQLLGQLESTSSNVEFLTVTQRQLDA